MKKQIWIVILAVVAVVFVVRFNQKPSSQDVIKIGVAVGETGDAADWGQGEFRVVQMYIDDVNAKGGINGEPIGLVVEDTKSTGEGTVNAVTKLINIDHVPAIIGPTWADSYQGGNSIAENTKTTLISPSAAIETIKHKENFTYFFSTWWPQGPEIQALENYMITHSIKTIAIINDRDAFNTQFSDDFESNAKSKGITVVDREQIAIDQHDLRTQILKIKQFSPDAVFIQISNVSELGAFSKQMRDLGLSARILSTPDAQNEDAVSKFGAFMEGLTYVFVKTPTGEMYDNFVKEYQTKYNGLPSAASALNAYNAISALVAVLKDGARTGTEIRDALYKVNAPGLGTPQVSFGQNGEIRAADFEIRMIHNSKFVTVTN